MERENRANERGNIDKIIRNMGQVSWVERLRSLQYSYYPVSIGGRTSCGIMSEQSSHEACPVDPGLCREAQNGRGCSSGLELRTLRTRMRQRARVPRYPKGDDLGIPAMTPHCIFDQART